MRAFIGPRGGTTVKSNSKFASLYCSVFHFIPSLFSRCLCGKGEDDTNLKPAHNGTSTWWFM